MNQQNDVTPPDEGLREQLAKATCGGCRRSLPIQPDEDGSAGHIEEIDCFVEWQICTSQADALMPIVDAARRSGFDEALQVASRHYRIELKGGSDDYFDSCGACVCGQLKADGVTPWEVLWREHIRSLTPTGDAAGQAQ